MALAAGHQISFLCHGAIMCHKKFCSNSDEFWGQPSSLTNLAKVNPPMMRPWDGRADWAGFVLVFKTWMKKHGNYAEYYGIGWGSSQSMNMKSYEIPIFREVFDTLLNFSGHDRLFSTDHRTTTKSAMTRIHLVASLKVVAQWLVGRKRCTNKDDAMLSNNRLVSFEASILQVPHFDSLRFDG